MRSTYLHRRRIQALLALFLATTTALSACDDRSPSLDQRDGSPCFSPGCHQAVDATDDLEDGGRDSFVISEIHDGGAGDLGSDQGDRDAHPLCEPVPYEEPLPGLRNGALINSIPLGGSISGQALLAKDLDGEEPLRSEIVMARGGRVEVVEIGGRTLWRSDVLAINRIIDAVDLNGDGRLELVVASQAGVYVFDAVGGEVLWRLPDDAFDTGQPNLVGRVLLGQLYGEASVDLYVTDGGCGDAGTGRSAIFTFGGDEFGARVSLSAGQRQGGRCGRWHTLRDVDDDGLAEVIMTDTAGLSVVEASTGRRISCGGLPEAPANGPLPTLPSPSDPRAWFVFLEDAVVRVELVVSEDDDCDRPLSFRTSWRSEVFDGILLATTRAVPRRSVDEDLLITSILNPDRQRWSVVAFAAHQHVEIMGDAVLDSVTVSADGEEASLAVRRTRGEQIDCQRVTLDLATLTVREVSDLEFCVSLRARSSVADRSDEFRSVLRLLDPQGGKAIYHAGGEAQTNRIIAGAGESAMDFQLVSDALDTLISACPERRACERDPSLMQLVFVTGTGRVGALDAHLNLLNPSVNDGGIPALMRPAGSAQVRLSRRDSETHLVVITEAGLVSAYDPAVTDARPLATRNLGRPARGQPLLRVARLPGGDSVAISREVTQNELGITALSIPGLTPRWRHDYSPDEAASMRVAEFVLNEAGVAELVVRYDRARRPGLLPNADCENDTILGENDPDSQCPTFERIVTALDAGTGRCVWRTVIQPTDPCAGPANQTLSILPSTAGEPSLIAVTESTGVHLLSADRGQRLASGDLGRVGNIAQGGGWLRRSYFGATPYILLGGNGPPRGLNSDLTVQWQAIGPPDLRSQSWILRDGLIDEEHLWIVPGQAHPITRYRVSDGHLDGAFAFDDGALRRVALGETGFENIEHVAVVSEIDVDSGSGLMLSTDSGRVYGLASSGELIWSRAFDSGTYRPFVADLLGDSELELVAPLTNGELQIFGPPAPAAPSRVRDVACPLAERCGDAVEIDEARIRTGLCAEWTPVTGVRGYRARVVRMGGVPETEWIDQGQLNRAEFRGLSLRSGSRFRVQVQTYRDGDDAVIYSESVTSDGVLIQNDSAPSIQLSASRDQLAYGAEDTLIDVRLEDDDTLAGWNVDVVDVVTGDHVNRIGAGPLSERLALKQVRWFGRDSFGRFVPPGAYRAEVTAVDQAGNLGTEDYPLVICDGVCP